MDWNRVPGGQQAEIARSVPPSPPAAAVSLARWPCPDRLGGGGRRAAFGGLADAVPKLGFWMFADGEGGMGQSFHPRYGNPWPVQSVDEGVHEAGGHAFSGGGWSSYVDKALAGPRVYQKMGGCRGSWLKIGQDIAVAPLLASCGRCVCSDVLAPQGKRWSWFSCKKTHDCH